MPKRVYNTVKEAIAAMKERDANKKTQLDQADRERVKNKGKAIEVAFKTIKVHAIKHYDAGVRPTAFEQKCRALATHICGEELRNAAIMHGISFHSLAAFKNQLLGMDASFGQFIENLFLQGAHDAIHVFFRKKDSMTATQAAIAAGIFAEKSTKMKIARTNEFKTDGEEDVISVRALEAVAGALEKINQAKQLKGRTIDAEATIERDGED